MSAILPRGQEQKASDDSSGGLPSHPQLPRAGAPRAPGVSRASSVGPSRSSHPLSRNFLSLVSAHTSTGNLDLVPGPIINAK